jgi:sulfite exporter TauE/SafE
MTSETLDLSASLLVALAASLHCVGMCGGFAAAAVPRPASAGPRAAGTAIAASQALFHAGKLSSYLFLGSLAALLGSGASRLGVWPGRVLAAIAGALLVSLGLKALGALPAVQRFAAPAGSGPSLWTRAARAWASLGTGLLALDGPKRPLLLGAFSGLLPCPLVYAFAAKAAASESPAGAIATMTALALGTVPALSVVAALGGGSAVRQWGAAARAWGFALIVLGGWTMLRGFSLAPCCG